MYLFPICSFQGTGLGLVGDPPFAVLGDYFDDNYSLVNCLAFLGSSAALIAIGPLTQILESTYGWRGALLVLGGIFLHATSSGALLRPISRNKGFNKHGYSTLHSRVKLTQDDKSDSVQGGGNSGTDSRCGCFSYCFFT